MSDAPALERPICSCGVPMIEMNGQPWYRCPHCDEHCGLREAGCAYCRNLDRAVSRKVHTTAPPPEMRKA